MTRRTNILTSKNAFIATLILAAVVLTFLAPQSAVNVDEQLHYPHAKSVVNWYFTGGEDVSCLNTPTTNLKYYGQSVDNFTALINRIFNIKNEFLTRHFTGAFFFLILLLFSGLLALQLSNSYWISVLTVLSMFAMPRLFGHAFGNLKDIPFAAGYISGLFYLVRFFKEMPKPSWKTTVFLGLAIAFTCSVRIGGLILFAYLGLFFIIYFISKPFELKHIVSTKSSFVRLWGQLTVIFIIGYFAGLLFWPYALQNVFINPVESLGVMEHYKVSIRQVFNGNLYWSTQLPWYYLPKWLLISSPEFLLPGFIGFLFYFLKQAFSKNKRSDNKLFYEGLVFFAFLFPTVYVIIIHSNLYSGVRQMIFILPVLAILVAVGFQKLYHSSFNKNIKYIGVVSIVFLMLLPLKQQAKNFPVNYIYFNNLAGGNENAWSNYEYDYYFKGIKEPAEYLKNMLKNEGEVTVAMNCNLFNYFEDSQNVSCQYVRFVERSSKDWEYGLFGINYIHPYLLEENKWQPENILKIFYHEGNPIAVILKRTNRNDYLGLEELLNGNEKHGEVLLNKVLQEDPNNVWLYVQLAKTSLLNNEEQKFYEYMKLGKAVYPNFEPWYLLEAQNLYNKKRYRESYDQLNKLIEVNYRYKPAADLLFAVKEKLNIK